MWRVEGGVCMCACVVCVCLSEPVSVPVSVFLSVSGGWGMESGGRMVEG